MPFTRLYNLLHNMTCDLLTDQRAFPYLTLGITPGVIRTYFPSVVDGSSEAIFIPGGFPFGQSNQTTVFVRVNICNLNE